MKIYNYISVHDFVNFVKRNFDVEGRDIHWELLEEDYIEGSLGSMYSYQDSYEDIDQEKQDWFNLFFEEHGITEVQLKYGS